MRASVSAFCILALCSQWASAADLRATTENLREAEVRWQAAAPSRYALKVSYGALVSTYGCNVQSFRVTGRGSSSDRISSCHSRPDKFGSVPALFRLTRKLLAGQPDEVKIEYDPIYGFPAKVYVGSASLEDSYFTFKVIEFRPMDIPSKL